MNPSSRCFPNDVVLQTVAPGNKASRSAGTTLRCSVQDAATDRRARIGTLTAKTTDVVGFPSFPVDASSGARASTPGNRYGPEINAGDILTWTPPDGGPARTLQALGPCRRAAGRRSLYEVDCQAIG